MNEEKWKRVLLILLTVLSSLALGYVGVRWLLPLVLPFLLSFALVFLVRSPAEKVGRRLKLPAGVSRLIFSLLSLLLLLGTLGFLIFRAAAEGWEFLSGLGVEEAAGMIDRAVAGAGLFPADDPALSEAVASAVGDLFSSVAAMLAGAVGAFVAGVPKLLFGVLVMAVSTVYFALDLEKIVTRVRTFLPKPLESRLSAIKEGALFTAVRYLRSYAILMAFTFALMLAGFLILGVRYALLLAVLVALLDALPVIGVGTILVPWSVVKLAVGDFRLGVGLLVLFAVSELTRQFLEPKIVGKNLGLHPLLTLFLLYAGYALFGIAGLLLLPLFTLALKTALSARSPKEGGEDAAG